MAKMFSSMDRNLRLTLICGTAVGTLLIGWKGIRSFSNRVEYKHLASLRRMKKEDKIKNKLKMKNYLDLNPMNHDEVERITTYSFKDLINLIKEKKLSHNTVLLAYQHKAFSVDLKLNCVVEFLFPDFSDVNLSGPLAGVPVSVKDNISLKGHDCTVGLSRMVHAPFEQDSVLVKVIKDLGGVPFVKTLVPQTMMSVLSSNPIDGVTLNPCDLSRSPGGSSSGEAALIGGQGSLIGFGTDIGGSVRLPAAFCGVVGFKPTSNIISHKDMLSLYPQPFISGCLGPLTRDVESCVEIMRHVINSPLHYRLDPEMRPLTFSEEQFSPRKLRIGFYLHNGVFEAVPAMKRAVLEVKAILEARGHELVEFTFPEPGVNYFHLFLKSVCADRGAALKRCTRNDECDSSIKNLLAMFAWGPLKRSFYTFKVTHLSPNPDYALWFRMTRGFHTVNDAWTYYASMRSAKNTFVRHMAAEGIDALLCPALATPACPVKPKGSFTGALSYQNIFNLLDMPAGTVPVTKVTAEDVAAMVEYPGHASWHKVVKEFQTGSEGLPVSVQCATLPGRDELCLRVMQEIQNCLTD